MEKHIIFILAIAIGILAVVLLMVFVKLVTFIGKAIVKEPCSFDLAKEFIAIGVLTTIIALGFLI